MVDLICIDGAHAHSGLKNLTVDGDDVILGLDPWAIHFLDEHAIPYRIPEEFYHQDELMAVYERAHKALELLCRIGDDFLGSAVPEMVSRSIYPFEHSIYLLMIIIDEFAYSLFEMQRVIDIFRPDRLVLPEPAARAGDELSWSKKETYDSNIVVQAGCQVPVTWLPLPADKNFITIGSGDIAGYKDYKSVLKGFVIRHQRLFRFAKGLQRIKFKGLFQCVTNKPALLVTDAEYEWRFCREQLRNSGYRLIYKDFDASAGKKEIKKPEAETLLTKLESNGEFRELLKIGDFDIFPLLRDKIAYVCDTVLATALKSFEDTQSLCRRKNIKGVLSCGFLSASAHALAAGAGALGKPVITWTHNGPPGIYVDLIIPRVDYESSDICFMGGIGGVHTFESQAKHYNCQLLPIGSASLDLLTDRAKQARPSKQERGGIRKLLYGLTCYHTGAHVYAIKDKVFSDRLYYGDQMKILNEMRNLRGVDVICKLHPNRALIDPPWVSDAPSWGFTVIKDELSFPALLEMADIIVLDNANTTIMQALATNKPIFLLVLDEQEYFTGILDKLKRRVGCYTDAAELALAVQRFIDTGDYPADLSDRTFFREFAVYLDDGQSAKRAVAEVIKVVSRRES